MGKGIGWRKRVCSSQSLYSGARIEATIFPRAQPYSLPQAASNPGGRQARLGWAGGQRWAAVSRYPEAQARSRACTGHGLAIREDLKPGGSPNSQRDSKLGGLGDQRANSLPPDGTRQQHPSPPARFLIRVRARGAPIGGGGSRAGTGRAERWRGRGRSGANFGGIGGGGRGRGGRLTAGEGKGEDERGGMGREAGGGGASASPEKRQREKN